MPLVEAARKSLQAAKSNAHLNAFISLHSDQNLLAQVSASNTAKARSSIDGRLIAVKDNICTPDLPTTCASKMLGDYLSPYEATVVHRVRSAGGVIMGKTNMDEFGMGTHSVFSAFGAVRGPGDENAPPRSSGGSSGGSAAAVAAGMCYTALGTDTGGSVRLPASYCGIVGFKPSYGMVSRWGVVAYANSLDTVGILGKDCESVRKLFDVVNGHDDNDPTSISRSARERIADRLQKGRNSGSLRIGLPLEYNLKELTTPVRTAWGTVCSQFASIGHQVIPVSLTATRHALPAYYVLAPAEASSNLAKYDGLRYGHRGSEDRSEAENILFAPTRRQGFGEEVRRRILLGAYTLSAGAMDNYFIKAQNVRRLVQRDFDNTFRAGHYLNEGSEVLGNPNGVDVLIAPCSLSSAPKLEDVLAQRSPLDSYVNDVLTVPASLAGIPAVSVPVSTTNEKGEETTVGMQVMGQYGDDEMVLQVAKMVQKLGRLPRTGSLH